MALSKEEKEKVIAQLAEKLSRSQALIMTDYRGLNVQELRAVRDRLRGESCGYHVVKNRLVRLAMEKAGSPFPETLFDGPTAIGFCYGDVVRPAKALVEYAKENRTLSIRGGVMGHKILSGEEITSIAQLPSREVLIAQLIGYLQMPIAHLASTLQSPIRNLTYLLHARKEQLEQV